MNLIPTASQTVGPFFNLGLTGDAGLGILATGKSNCIELTFRIIDGDGQPTPGDAMIEIWQADSNGNYAQSPDTDFRGFGRLDTDLNGVCVFQTVKPGRVTNSNGSAQAPHINVVIFARGLGKQLNTRVYFEGEAANAEDPVLALVPLERRKTLLATAVAGQANHWSIEIRLQGEGETVFFDV
jgi:protocatechuate 3,4-dioxygenase alpha subunit